jgi:phosphomannomutase
VTGPELRARAAAWIADDPDQRDRAELQALLDDGGPAAEVELAGRFSGRLEFGTAGLRGAVAAGPARMNRAVVRGATAALAGWLLARHEGTAEAGVVIGCDARHRSQELYEEAAAVLAGAGFRVHLLPPRQPTPLLAFAVPRLGAAAGIMITASHNPPADNGYKLYLADGAQIVPPADAEIEAAIRDLGPLSSVPVADPGSPLITRHGDEIAAAYLDAVTSGPATSGPAASGQATSDPGAPGPTIPIPTSASGPAGPSSPGRSGAGLRFVYTPLHGVAAGLALRAFAQAGYPAPGVVAAQAEPDPDFPTVAFPNPEVPGALDLAIGEACRSGAELVIANDPDGDRLAVAVPDPDSEGGWRTLTGDQLGALLGSYVLERTAGQPDPGGRLVATTVVSSTLLARVAAAAGARYAETLTGFKWIVRAAEQRPGSRYLFGYEEALGYAIGGTVRDKDGIGAALAALGLASAARERGQTLLDVYGALEAEHGVHLTGQLTLATTSPAEVMARLRSDPPEELGGLPVTGRTDLSAGTPDLPPSDLLSYQLDGARVVIRPSGTEPKIKAYLQVTELPGAPLAEARRAARDRMGPLSDAVRALLAG